ncbi:MAG TPA: hypothetical protein VMD79_12965 [Solirubrobacteraceae bacterium]|nr:hypothetical protein [Solirubrobacteraceae bacterium]
MARVLIVAGGRRGRTLAGELIGEGHAVRISTRSEQGRAAIEAAGAECWIGTPDRLATLRGALDGVTILCWLLGACTGSERELRELHTARLEFFLTQAIDTTVRGFVYEARGTSTPADVLAQGEHVVRRLVARNSIPVAFLTADPLDVPAWLADAHGAIAGLLSGG